MFTYGLEVILLVKLYEIGRRFSMLNLLRRIELHRATTDVGLHLGQLPVMEYIIRNEGCTQIEIADTLKVTPASIAISTKRLQKAGLIQKKTDENNLRCNKLSATQKGIELSQNCRDRFNEFDKKLFAGFSDQELLIMKDHLDRLMNNIADGQEADIGMFAFAALENKIKKANMKKR